MNWLSKKPTEKGFFNSFIYTFNIILEMQRHQEKELRTVNRNLATDLRQLEQKEKELVILFEFLNIV